MKNLEFAADADKENEAVQEKLQWAKSQRAADKPTIPSTIGVSYLQGVQYWQGSELSSPLAGVLHDFDVVLQDHHQNTASLLQYLA